MKENIVKGYHITEDGYLFSKKSGIWKKRKGMVYRNYLQYMIQGKWYKAHRLVAMVYIPNPNNYPIVMHKDNNPLNNYKDNLMWGTHSMNNLQCSKEGRGIQYRLKGKLNPMYGVKGELHPSYGKPGAMKGKPSPMKGKVHRESSKCKISDSLKSLHRTKLTERKKRRIMRLRNMNKSQSYIASRVKLHQTAISKFLKGGLG
jgi:hypothetical protein